MARHWQQDSITWTANIHDEHGTTVWWKQGATERGGAPDKDEIYAAGREEFKKYNPTRFWLSLDCLQGGPSSAKYEQGHSHPIRIIVTEIPHFRRRYGDNVAGIIFEDA